MNFSRLPDTAFLKIFDYLPLEDCIRAGRVDKAFRRIAQLTTSRTKSLDLTEERFKNLSDDHLAVIMDLCSSNLERIKFPSRLGLDQRATILNNRGGELARTFAFYHCPRSIDIHLGHASIDSTAFSRLIRNNPNVESLLWWGRRLVGFPNVTMENLKKLTLNCSNDASVQSIIGRCPNLKELELTTGNSVTATTLDRVFASISQVHRLNLSMEFGWQDLVNLWNLPLTSLSISATGSNEEILYKVASSFPHLQNLCIYKVEAPTSNGIAALAVLQELEVLKLPIFPDPQNDYQQGLRQLARCKKLRTLDMFTSYVSGGILITLLRGCPQLNYIDIDEIDDVNNPNEAVEFLEGLRGMAKRDITIAVIELKSIWEAESVEEMIKTLEENDGVKIKINCFWSDIPELVFSV